MNSVMETKKRREFQEIRGGVLIDHNITYSRASKGRGGKKSFNSEVTRDLRTSPPQPVHVVCAFSDIP